MTNQPKPPSSRRPRDLVISLLVLLVPTLVLVGGYQVLAGRHDPVPVDSTAQIAAAHHAGLEVHVPEQLGEQWVPVTAAFQQEELGPTLRLGYLTPDGHPVQLAQTAAPVNDVVGRELGAGAQALEAAPSAGATWWWYDTQQDKRALVRHEAGLTLVIVGPEPAAQELTELAASLR